MTQAEKFPDPFACRHVNLFNHLVRKADVAGCCSGGLFVDMRLPCSGSVADLYCLKLFLRVKLMQINYYDTCVIIDYLTWFDGLTHVVICR